MLTSKTKSIILNKCKSELQSRRLELDHSLKSLKESKDSQTKSSVGDKHEVGRAMMQIEEERLVRQLTELDKMLMTLQRIDPETTSNTIALGSLVATNHAKYFISVALGKVNIEDESYYCVSVQSPIGKALLGKSVYDEFEFNEMKFSILHSI